ncbi:MAG: Zn-dependent protease with chaperone function [Planctomycetota bacterium]|jgi:Zn-dependent protease with chaperone function
MIAGVVSFLFAALQVAGFNAESGVLVSGAVLLPVVFIVVFDLIHRRSTNRIKQARESNTGQATGRTRESSPWSLVFMHQLGFMAILHFGWSRLVQVELGLGGIFLLPGILMILPWLAVHVSSIYHRWRLDEGERLDPWPLAGFLCFNLRVLIVPVLPCLIFSIIAWLGTNEPTRSLMAAYPSFEMLISLGLTLSIVVFSPFLVRAAVASDPMPESPMRDRFEAIAQEGGFRFLDIRIARTHNRIVNAMFVGVAGRLRYVFMTDAILSQLSEEDLDGVFAHEMGHSRRGHILLNMAMFLGLSLFMHLSMDVDQVESSSIAAFFLYPFFIFFVFSPVAKAFESEADAFAGEILGDPGPIRRSLETMGRMYPKRMKDGGLVHPSIEQRVGFLGLYFNNPDVAKMFRHRLRRIKITIGVFFAVPLLLWINTWPSEYRVGGLRAGAMEASANEDGVSAQGLLERYDNEINREVDDPSGAIQVTLWQTVAIAAQSKEDFAKAAPMIQLMREQRDDFESPIFVYNTSILSAQQAAGTGDWPRLTRERRRAEEELDVLEALMPNDPQLVQEREDIQLLTAIETTARRLKALPPTVNPEPLPAPKTPEISFLHVLVGRETDIQSPSGTKPEEEKLSPGWKRASLQLLKTIATAKQDQ